jgi:nitrite reductase/ring-hydroxylating ferredoxin subunit
MSEAPEGRENALPPVEYFVICSAGDIEVGGAKAFDLEEVDEAKGGGKPFRIVVARNAQGAFFGYRNVCPHHGVWLNIGSGAFFDETGALLKCGRHGAKFEVESGKCLSGPCEGEKLQQVSLAVLDGDVCLHGVKLVEEDGMRWHEDDMDETMEITIHPG